MRTIVRSSTSWSPCKPPRRLLEMNDTWVSILALVLSVISLGVSAWSAWVGSRALSHEKTAHFESRWIAFSAARSAFLVEIEDAKTRQEQVKQDIELCLASIASQDDALRLSFKEDAALLLANANRMAMGLRQAESLWSEVFEWNEKTGPSALAHHQPRFRALLAADLATADGAERMVAAIQSRLALFAGLS